MKPGFDLGERGEGGRAGIGVGEVGFILDTLHIYIYIYIEENKKANHVNTK